MLPKQEWGTKRLCVGCGERYYDLLRNPITCPKCGENYVPIAVTKSRRVAPAKPKRAAVATAGSATLAVVKNPEVAAPGKEEDVADIVVVDAADNDREVMEDPSELGEDEDDMAEVIEGSREDQDKQD